MSDKLGRLRTGERAKLTAGQVEPDIEKLRQAEAAQRASRFLREQQERNLATDYYLQEVAELDGHEDGRFLTQVLDRIAEEIRVLLIRGSKRELALVLTKVEEAKHWATQHGENTNSHVVIDRRFFRTNYDGE
jgi:hypothetical protein